MDILERIISLVDEKSALCMKIYVYIRCWFAPFSSSVAYGFIDAFPTVWNHRPADHHPSSVAPRKTHPNALAVRCRQEPISFTYVKWDKMKSRTAIVSLKSRADKKYLTDHDSDYVVQLVEKKNNNNLIIKCRPTCNNFGGRWITFDKWHDQLKSNISELPVPLTSKCVRLLPTRVKVVVWSHRLFQAVWNHRPADHNHISYCTSQNTFKCTRRSL